ncbi:hypothetical protein K466DRAFT_205000 [Polyporus arcularius HHB13444]|uniref:Uncharacterized protein n=1 Tax=Polyporus arcularius HHB13444 TaxID=1314778 RepID=A0A5C3P5P8_9APHY|nr:hypothetical protein K466DRAFT_205000 [Polyporus arcularius HHB13444]
MIPSSYICFSGHSNVVSERVLLAVKRAYWRQLAPIAPLPHTDPSFFSDARDPHPVGYVSNGYHRSTVLVRCSICRCRPGGSVGASGRREYGHTTQRRSWLGGGGPGQQRSRASKRSGELPFEAISLQALRFHKRPGDRLLAAAAANDIIPCPDQSCCEHNHACACAATLRGRAHFVVVNTLDQYSYGRGRRRRRQGPVRDGARIDRRRLDRLGLARPRDRDMHLPRAEDEAPGAILRGAASGAHGRSWGAGIPAAVRGGKRRRRSSARRI